MLSGRIRGDIHRTVEKTNIRLISNRFSLYNVIFHASRAQDKAVVYRKPEHAMPPGASLSLLRAFVSQVFFVPRV